MITARRSTMTALTGALLTSVAVTGCSVIPLRVIAETAVKQVSTPSTPVASASASPLAAPRSDDDPATAALRRAVGDEVTALRVHLDTIDVETTDHRSLRLQGGGVGPLPDSEMPLLGVESFSLTAFRIPEIRHHLGNSPTRHAVVSGFGDGDAILDVHDGGPKGGGGLLESWLPGWSRVRYLDLSTRAGLGDAFRELDPVLGTNLTGVEFRISVADSDEGEDHLMVDTDDGSRWSRSTTRPVDGGTLNVPVTPAPPSFPASSVKPDTLLAIVTAVIKKQPDATSVLVKGRVRDGKFGYELTITTPGAHVVGDADAAGRIKLY